MDFKETGTSQPGELYILLHFPFMFLRVIWLFIVALALRKLALIDNSQEQLFFVHKTGTALQEIRGGFGSHTHSFSGLSRDLILAVVNNNALMTLCHL